MKHPPNCTILIAEDDRNDQLLIRRAFAKISTTINLHCVSDGSEAIAYLDGTDKYSDRAKYPFPSILITDLKMPLANGFDVLTHLASNPEWSVIPVIVLSASPDGDDIKMAYMAGAKAYLIKPSSIRELESLLRKLYEFWSAADVPQVDANGKLVPTTGEGKMGHKICLKTG